MRRDVRLLAAIGLAVWVSLVSGCSASLTGGSIPPGGGVARLSGLMIRGDNANVPLIGAKLRILPPTARGRVVVVDPPPPPGFPDNGGSGGSGDGGGTVTGQDPAGTIYATSGADGSFSASGLKSGRNTIEVTSPIGSGLANVSYTLDVSTGGSYWLVLAPLPSNFNTQGFTGIDVSPEMILATVGQAQQIMVQLLGGAPPHVVPSYLLTGDCGFVNTRGEFVAVRHGSGSLRVKVGPYEKTLTVRVAAAN